MPTPLTTYQTPFLSEILSGSVIPQGKLAYFRARLSNNIHELVLSVFMRLERENKINKAELARRIGRKPEQVTRWLAAPGNWTFETFSDLLLGMGYEPQISFSSLAEKKVPGEDHISESIVEIPKDKLGMPSQEGATNALNATAPSLPTPASYRWPPFQHEQSPFANSLRPLSAMEARP